MSGARGTRPPEINNMSMKSVKNLKTVKRMCVVVEGALATMAACCAWRRAGCRDRSCNRAAA